MRHILGRALIVSVAAGRRPAGGARAPSRRAPASGMVATQEARASQVGVQALADGGTAVDAAVATAFALAVTHPTAGNIGGGGFLLLRTAAGDAGRLRLPRDGAGAARPRPCA